MIVPAENHHPHDDPGGVRGANGWEAEQHIPSTSKVMSIDYEVLRKRPEAGRVDLVLVAAKKQEIDDFAAILREANLRPIVVDMNAFTIQNVEQQQEPQVRHRGALNVSAVSWLNIISGGVSAFSSQSPTPAVSVAEEIQKQCNMPVEQAEASSAVADRDANGPSRRCAGDPVRVRRPGRGNAGSARLYSPTSGEADHKCPSRVAPRISPRSAGNRPGARGCRCRCSTP